MNKIFFNEFIQDYFNFKKNLSNNIKNENVIYTFNDCYLIDELWIKLLEILIKKFLEGNNITFPIKKPKFINSFLDFINYLKDENNLNFKLISKTLIESIYSKNELKNNICVKCLCSNNKLIIDFQDINEKNSLLIQNPLNTEQIKTNTYIINRDNNYLYRILLLEIGNIKFSKYINSITPFKDYLKSFLSKNIIKNYNNNNFKNCLLKILIYLFYYEKSLLFKREDFFDENKKYYLISSQWLNEYKRYYNFQNLNNVLMKINNKEIEFDNIDNYYLRIINTYLNKFILDFSKLGLPNDLKDIKNLDPLYNLVFFF